MKKNLWQNLALAAALFVTACTSPAVTNVPATPTTAAPGHALLIIKSGEVQLKRSGWKKYYPASFGTVLYRGDLIQPSGGAEIFVVCQDLQVWSVPAGGPSGVGAGCPQGGEPVLERGKTVLSNTRGADNRAIPYLISPRAFNLMDETPVFRWNPVVGAASYTVSLLRGEELLWSEQTNKAELEYPAGRPVLESGVVYSWSVEADNATRSTDDTTPFLSFQLLNTSQIHEVKSRSERLAASQLPEAGRYYAQAWLYVRYGLYSDAIETMANQAKIDPHSAAVYRMSGELHDQIALPFLARSFLEEAVRLAEGTGDIENLAEIQLALGRVYNKLGETDLSAQILSKAKDGFEELEETEKVKEVEELIRQQ